MNTKQLIAAAAIALVGSTSAFAQSEAGLQHIDVPSATKVQRADVKAEYVRAAAAGEIVPVEVAQAKAPNAKPSGLTRAEVRAELKKALADGSLEEATEVAMFDADSNKAGNARTRAEVRAEALAYTRSARVNRTESMQ